MIDAAAYADSLRLPVGATDETKLRLRVSELKRIVRLAYIQGTMDALEPLKRADAEMPDFFKGLFV